MLELRHLERLSSSFSLSLSLGKFPKLIKTGNVIESGTLTTHESQFAQIGFAPTEIHIHIAELRPDLLHMQIYIPENPFAIGKALTSYDEKHISHTNKRAVLSVQDRLHTNVDQGGLLLGLFKGTFSITFPKFDLTFNFEI